MRDGSPSGGRTRRAPRAPASRSRRASRPRPARPPAPPHSPAALAVVAGQQQRHQGHERGRRGQPDQHPLGAGRADRGDQHQAKHQGARDGAERVGRINATDEPPGIMPAGSDRGERQREARSPQARRRQDGPEAAHQVELQGVPGARRQRRDDRPVGERLARS